MTRRLLSLLLTLGALTACNEQPPGQLQPIPRPADYKPPPKVEAPKPAEAPVDPNKVTLRWSLAPDTPVAYRLDGTPGSATLYVLQRPKEGDLVVRLASQGSKSVQDQGTFSERGFILDGLSSADRNMATLLLELPKDPVGVGSTWSLGTDMLDLSPLGRTFLEKKRDRHNIVKVAAVAPDGDDRVVTIEYDILEQVSGVIPPNLMAAEMEPEETAPIKAAKEKGKSKGKDKSKLKPQEMAKAMAEAGAERPISTEVSFTGKGEFLVKAGRWRSWEGTLSSKTEGYTPSSPEKTTTKVPPGTLKLKLSSLDSVPAELQQPEAKK